MKRALLACVIALSTTGMTTHAESIDSISYDSISTTTSMALPKHTFTQTPLYQITAVGLPLIATGIIMKGEDNHIYRLRNDYAKDFSSTVDNYIQYLPGAVMLGMKACGVKGRSSWGRMLTSDAFTVAMMATLVNASKYTVKVKRPDGSNDKSFPSGHTATAFMTATMLTKEYGHLSPWVGIGAYTVATGTGVMRIANNKHWLSDVFTGAGIGVISTELGYYLADLVFGQKGLTHNSTNTSHFDRSDKPSFVGLYLGANIPLSRYAISQGTKMNTSCGSVAGVEGAYFFNPYIGVGGRLAIANTHVSLDDDNIESTNYDALTGMVGPYVSYPITARWLVGSKLVAGYVGYPKTELSDGTIIKNHSGLGMGSGISLTYRAKENYGFKVFVDYNLQSAPNKEYGGCSNQIAIGTSFGIQL